jgi:hypothetical protein
MMGRFLHNPDDWITIEGDATHTLVLTLDEFKWYEPAYGGVPAPYIGRTYVQGQFHIVYTHNAQFAASLPWPDGDAYISNLATYQASQVAKQKHLRVVAVQAELDQTQNGVISAMEWAINYLITKGIIAAADVPAAVTALLNKRKALKAELANASS